jgi:hypothetical protein
MKLRQFAMRFQYFLVGVLALAGFWPAHGLAFSDQTRTRTSQRHAPAPNRTNQSEAFFRDVSQPN